MSAIPVVQNVLEVKYSVYEEDCKQFESHLRPRLADVLALPGRATAGVAERVVHFPVVASSRCSRWQQLSQPADAAALNSRLSLQHVCRMVC